MLKKINLCKTYYTLKRTNWKDSNVQKTQYQESSSKNRAEVKVDDRADLSRQEVIQGGRDFELLEERLGTRRQADL